MKDAGLLVAFQNASFQPADTRRKTAWLSEGELTARAEFGSVLTDAKGATGPRVPFGEKLGVPGVSW